MKIHIYRPYFLSFSFRSYKIVDAANRILGLLDNQSEVVIDNSPDKIRLKVDWYGGSHHFQDTDVEEKFLICYFAEKTVVGMALNFRFKNLIKLKEVTKEEYLKAIETKGTSLPFYQGAVVTKLESILSRILSGLELFASALLFYQTDYNGNADLKDLEFLRFIALLIALGGIFGLVWNINKHMKLSTRVIVGIVFIGYAGWQVQLGGGNWLIFLPPVFLMLGVLGFYNLRRK